VGDSPGLVFLQYRNETKRALLPNEITSIDTVKALFVRSFPKQLTMEYLDSPHVKVYIHDSNKDMFYELEDLRYDSLPVFFFFHSFFIRRASKRHRRRGERFAAYCLFLPQRDEVTSEFTNVFDRFNHNDTSHT